MSTERLENTASIPLTIEHREERILTPIRHSFVIGVSWTIATMLLCLTLLIAVADIDEPHSEGVIPLIALVSLAAGVVAFVLAYTRRDAWLRESTSLTNITSKPIETRGQVHQSSAITPVRSILAEEPPGVDEFLRVSDSLLIRLQLPPELGITSRNIMDLALKIHGGDTSWSKRALKGIIPENSYMEFSTILKGRGVLRNAPNKSFALTQEGLDLFCNVVDTGAPPPTTTT